MWTCRHNASRPQSALAFVRSRLRNPASSVFSEPRFIWVSATPSSSALAVERIRSTLHRGKVMQTKAFGIFDVADASTFALIATADRVFQCVMAPSSRMGLVRVRSVPLSHP